MGRGEPIQSRRRRAQRQSCQEDARLRRSQLRPVPAQHSHLRRFPLGPIPTCGRFPLAPVPTSADSHLLTVDSRLRPIPTSADALVKRLRWEHARLSLALSGNGTSGSRRKREKTARRKWEIRMGTGARHDVALHHVRRRLPVHAPRAVHPVPAWTCEGGEPIPVCTQMWGGVSPFSHGVDVRAWEGGEPIAVCAQMSGGEEPVQSRRRCGQGVRRSEYPVSTQSTPVSTRVAPVGTQSTADALRLRRRGRFAGVGGGRRRSVDKPRNLQRPGTHGGTHGGTLSTHGALTGYSRGYSRGWAARSAATHLCACVYIYIYIYLLYIINL